MSEKPNVIAIFVAYNAASTLEDFYASFPKHLVDEIILVDDASRDNTYEIAQRLGIHAYKNDHNLGYGGNMKRALRLALQNSADIIIDIHPDGEYKTSAITPALQKVSEGARLVLGNLFAKTLGSPLEHGMYRWKLLPITLLNYVAKFVLRAPIDDFHQGFRVYTKDLLQKVNFEANENNYLFSFEIISQAVYHRMLIEQVPVETLYSGKKRGASLRHSIQYSLGVLKVLCFFLLAKTGLYRHSIFTA